MFLFTVKQDVKFAWTYPKPPTVVITAKHSSSGANSAAECNGIVSWVEVQKNGIYLYKKYIRESSFNMTRGG